MEKMSTKRLAAWGEQAARTIPVRGRISGRRTARRLADAMAAVTEKSRDTRQTAWFADNEYLARRETGLALAAFRGAGPLRRGPDGAALVTLCRRLVQAGPVTEERVEAFLTGARRQGDLPEDEAALVGPALRAAIVESLAQEGVDTAAAAELFTSLRTLADLDLTDALEHSDPVDALLRADPVYPAMDESSRALYRRRLGRYARRERLTALEAAQRALETGLHGTLFPEKPDRGAWCMAAPISCRAAPGARRVSASRHRIYRACSAPRSPARHLRPLGRPWTWRASSSMAPRLRSQGV